MLDRGKPEGGKTTQDEPRPIRLGTLCEGHVRARCGSMPPGAARVDRKREKTVVLHRAVTFGAREQLSATGMIESGTLVCMSKTDFRIVITESGVAQLRIHPLNGVFWLRYWE